MSEFVLIITSILILISILIILLKYKWNPSNTLRGRGNPELVLVLECKQWKWRNGVGGWKGASWTVLPS